jgi:uncharacterized integral membrane protein
MTMEHDSSDSGGKYSRKMSAESGRSGPNVTLIAIIVVIVLVVIFFLRNGDRLELDFLVVNKNTTVRWLIAVSVLLGVLLDRFASIWWRRRRAAKRAED